MTTLTLELQPELYARLIQEAARLGQPVETLVAEWWNGASRRRRRLVSASAQSPCCARPAY